MKNIRKILLYNPAISSLNMGDHIIAESIKNEMSWLIHDSFIVEVSTHLPVSRYIKYLKNFDYKFVCGSNLLRGKMNRLFRQWDINFLHSSFIGPSILVGAGWWQYGDDPNFYTKKLYKKVLSADYIHSVRDSFTEYQLAKIGITNVLNTGCPSMWTFTKEHCEKIPEKKAENVVFTITDYNRDKPKDFDLIKILLNNYKQVFFWMQGTNDLDYLHDLSINMNLLEIIPPSLSQFDKILEGDIDYVGTRLHAGIRALQKKKRSIIISIDNRARELQIDYNIPCIERSNLQGLELLINNKLTTEIIIPIEKINHWKAQFN